MKTRTLTTIPCLSIENRPGRSHGGKPPGPLEVEWHRSPSDQSGAAEFAAGGGRLRIASEFCVAPTPDWKCVDGAQFPMLLQRSIVLSKTQPNSSVAFREAQFEYLLNQVFSFLRELRALLQRLL